MNAKIASSITAGLTALLIAPAFAIEGPEDDAPPPVAQSNAKTLPEIKLDDLAATAPKKDRAFLGIISGKVPEMLADHLHLNPNEGIVVRSLVPDGPAAKSGIKINDVITKVSGKPVGSPEEITRQVSAHSAGEDITLDLIHEGKPTQVNVTLGNRPAEMAANDPQPLNQQDLDNLPDDLADRVRGSIAGNFGGLHFQLGGLDDPDLQKMQEDAKRLLKQKLKSKMQGFSQPNLFGANQGQMHSASTIKMMDGQGSVEIKSSNDTKNVTVRDNQGNSIWSGPWNSAQDKDSAPPEIRKRVESLNLRGNSNHNGLHLQMQQTVPDDQEP
jgi:serine protease Do